MGFYAPFLSSGITQQAKVFPSLTHIVVKLVKGPWSLHATTPATNKSVFALHLLGKTSGFLEKSKSVTRIRTCLVNTLYAGEREREREAYQD